MNKPLSKMFQIFSGRSRSEKTDLMLSRYCTCGALKPEPVTQEGGPSLNNQEQQLPGYSADARFADGVGTYASPVRSRTNRYWIGIKAFRRIRLECMSDTNSAAAIYDTHIQAEDAVNCSLPPMK